MKPVVAIGLVAVAAAASACIFFDDLGGGCETEGTLGAEGNIRFHFMQSDEDLSSSSGNAFSAGTTASVRLEAVDEDESPGSWSLRSSDEEILTVEEPAQDVENEDYPVAVSMNKEGEARIEVVSSRDGGLVDYVSLKVLTPDGLRAQVSHAALGTDEVDEAIALAKGGDGCVLDFFPVNREGAAEKYLFGEFELACEPETTALFLDHVPISADHPCYSINVASGTSGAHDLACVGPCGCEAAFTVLSVSAAKVDGFDIVFKAESGDGTHAGDWGYLTGLQYTSDVPLCSGHAVAFWTSDPYIACLDREGVPSEAEDTVRFSLQHAGFVVITACLEENADVGTSIELVVQPSETY